MSSQNNWNNPDMYYQQPQAGPPGGQSYNPNAVYDSNAQYAGGPGHIYQPLPPMNVLAIIGMCAAIFGVVSSFFIAGIGGIIMGHIARKQIRERGERGDGMAIAALWIGYIGTGLWLLFWVLMLLFYFGMFALLIAAEAGAS